MAANILKHMDQARSPFQSSDGSHSFGDLTVAHDEVPQNSAERRANSKVGAPVDVGLRIERVLPAVHNAKGSSPAFAAARLKETNSPADGISPSGDAPAG